MTAHLHANREEPGNGAREEPGNGPREGPGNGAREEPGNGTREEPGNEAIFTMCSSYPMGWCHTHIIRLLPALVA